MGLTEKEEAVVATAAQLEEARALWLRGLEVPQLALKSLGPASCLSPLPEPPPIPAGSGV